MPQPGCCSINRVRRTSQTKHEDAADGDCETDRGRSLKQAPKSPQTQFEKGQRRGEDESRSSRCS